ncbi:hypothetical protein ACNKHM_16570 [Shigella sonnei]
MSNRCKITTSICSFLGVDAIHSAACVSTHNQDEARLNRRMCEVAERIIVVTYSSKFNRSKFT